MKTIRVKNTYDIRIKGGASDTLHVVSDQPKTVALLVAHIPHIKPRLLVKVGQKVKVGTPLVEDKRQPEVKFVSPGGGEVADIKFGPRRRIDEIIIALDTSEQFESFQKIDDVALNKMSRDQVVSALLNGGLWGLIRSFPFKNIPNPSDTPNAIYVSLDDDEPFTPNSKLFLQGKEQEIKLGLSILRKLADKVVVGVAADNNYVRQHFLDDITHAMEGHYPANNPGVLHYYTKKSAEDNKGWFLRGQDLLRIVELFTTGQYPTTQIVTLAGTESERDSHYQIRVGAPFSTVLGDYTPTEPTRFIAGGVLTGIKTAQDSYFPYQVTALNVLRDGKPVEMFTFFRPGFDKPTFSKTYLSALLPFNKWKMDTSLNGGHRACVACGHCPQVCPVELLPQYIMKDLKAGDIEDALAQGLLDCVDCGLCSYVCPSKIDLDVELAEAKAKIAKEVL